MGLSQPKLTPINYKARIKKLLDLIGTGPRGSSFVLTSQPAAFRNRNMEHPYRQESSIYYLTGFQEPESTLVLCGNRETGDQVHLFLRDKDPLHELWEGRRLGVSAASSKLPIDKAYPISEFWNKLPELLEGSEKLYYHFGMDEEADIRMIDVLKSHRKKRGRTISSNLPVVDSDEVLGRMRLYKSPEEVERMRHAAQITSQTFSKIYEFVRPGTTEKEVNGLIIGEFLKNGADMEAYGSIVAGGANATVLHYRDNNQPLKDGDLILIDAGSQFDYYASDVTRTFPVGKKFSPAQKAIYEIVYNAQKQAIDAAKPGSTLTKMHETAIGVITDGLIDLKILKGSRSEIIEKATFKKYFPHNTSHWIGMDTHDIGDYFVDGKPRSLEPGMYFSVEPGIYFDPSDDSVSDEFKGIGIRIEDDVLVTPNGNEVLTQSIKKQVADMEGRF